MKRLILILLLLASPAWAPTFTEFYVTGTGVNLNSGCTQDDAAKFSGTGGFLTNSGSANLVWQKTGSDLSLVSTTNWASVYPDAATTNVFVGRVVAVDDTADTITVSYTAKAGTAPAEDTAGATSIKVGGAWKGPHTNTFLMTYDNYFPFGFINFQATNVGGFVPRVNFKGMFYITNAILASSVGPIIWQGYTATPGDGGFAGISAPIGSGAGASIELVTSSAADQVFSYLVFTNNGSSGNADGYRASATTEQFLYRCIATKTRASGIRVGASSSVIECEAYACNAANNSGSAGFQGSGGGINFIRCYAHDNVAGANCDGFRMEDQQTAISCISENNANHGFRAVGTTVHHYFGCEAYNNTGSGLDFTGASATLIVVENCNFLNNGAYGIHSSGSANRIGWLSNIGFGSGTEANSTADLGPALHNGIQAGAITNSLLSYAADVTPWTDPVNGNFSITLTAAKAQGSGAFLQSTINTPTNTVAYPDIGAAQSASTNAGGSVIIRRAIFSQ